MFDIIELNKLCNKCNNNITACSSFSKHFNRIRDDNTYFEHGHIICLKFEKKVKIVEVKQDEVLF